MAHYLKERYTNDIAPALYKSLSLSNPMEVPPCKRLW